MFWNPNFIYIWFYKLSKKIFLCFTYQLTLLESLTEIYQTLDLTKLNNIDLGLLGRFIYLMFSLFIKKKTIVGYIFLSTYKSFNLGLSSKWKLFLLAACFPISKFKSLHSCWGVCISICQEVDFERCLLCYKKKERISFI